MPAQFGQGFRITNNEPIDDRLVYDTVDDVIDADSPIRIGTTRRYDGLIIWIKSLQQWWGFIGGTSNDHFVPVSVGGGDGMLPSDTTFLKALAEKLTAEGHLPLQL